MLNYGQCSDNGGQRRSLSMVAPALVCIDVVVSSLVSEAPGGVGFLILITETLQTHKANSGGPSCAVR